MQIHFHDRPASQPPRPNKALLATARSASVVSSTLSPRRRQSLIVRPTNEAPRHQIMFAIDLEFSEMPGHMQVTIEVAGLELSDHESLMAADIYSHIHDALYAHSAGHAKPLQILSPLPPTQPPQKG